MGIGGIADYPQTELAACETAAPMRAEVSRSLHQIAAVTRGTERQSELEAPRDGVLPPQTKAKRQVVSATGEQAW